MSTLQGQCKAFHGHRHLLLLRLYLVFSFLGNFTAAAIKLWQYSPLVSFSSLINKASKKEISGRGLSVCGLEGGYESMDASDYLDSLALVTGRYNGGTCYPYSGNSNANYNVTKATIKKGEQFFVTGYDISPPGELATIFVASKTHIMWKLPYVQEYNLYSFEDGNINLLQSGLKPSYQNEFVLTDVTVSELNSNKIFFVQPSFKRVTTWPEAKTGTTTERAILWNYGGVGLFADRVSVPDTPYVISSGYSLSPSDWNHRYVTHKRFFRVNGKWQMKEGVVWQAADMKIYLTWFKPNGGQTKLLANPGDAILVAAAGDQGTKGDVVYITMEEGGGSNKDSVLTARAFKYNMYGLQQESTTFDTAKSALNIHAFSSPGSSLTWNTNTNQLAWIVSRTMTRSGDGLNHQGAVAVIINGDDLSIAKYWGQTSSHSFANSMTTLSNGDFLSVEIGDNYPRGVNVIRFGGTSSRKNKLVYSFKTQHSTSPKGSIGIYDEISTPGQTYYKWSNDNNVYTEIAYPGGVEVGPSNDILFVFSGEKDSLNNAKATGLVNAPRNIGFVKVSSDLSTITSQGITQDGGFYTYGGSFVTQKNEGIRWLTNFSPDETDESGWLHASRVKIAKISYSLILVFYELWSSSGYIQTEYLGINPYGKITIKRTVAPFPFRLTPTDIIEVSDGCALFYDGELPKNLIRYSLCPSKCKDNAAYRHQNVSFKTCAWIGKSKYRIETLCGKWAVKRNCKYTCGGNC